MNWHHIISIKQHLQGAVLILQADMKNSKLALMADSEGFAA